MGDCCKASPKRRSTADRCERSCCRRHLPFSDAQNGAAAPWLCGPSATRPFGYAPRAMGQAHTSWPASPLALALLWRAGKPGALGYEVALPSLPSTCAHISPPPPTPKPGPAWDCALPLGLCACIIEPFGYLCEKRPVLFDGCSELFAVSSSLPRMVHRSLTRPCHNCPPLHITTEGYLPYWRALRGLHLKPMFGQS